MKLVCFLKELSLCSFCLHNRILVFLSLHLSPAPLKMSVLAADKVFSCGSNINVVDKTVMLRKSLSESWSPCTKESFFFFPFPLPFLFFLLEHRV